MKKFIFTSVLAMFFFAFGNAQYKLVSNPVPFEGKSYFESIYPFGVYKDSYLFYKKYVSKKQPDELVMVNNTSAKFEVVGNVNKEDKISLWGLNYQLYFTNRMKFHNEESCGIIYFSWQKGKKYYIWKRDVVGSGKKLSTPNTDEKYLKQVILDKKMDCRSYTAASPDYNKYALLVNILENKKNDWYYQKSNLYVFNNRGEIEYETSFTMKFARSSFAIQNVVVNNDGKVFVVANTYVLQKNRQENQAIQAFMIDENGLRETSTLQKKDVYVTDMALKTLNNGNLFIGGYYATKSVNAERVIGYFGHDVGDYESEGKFGIILGKSNLEEISFNIIPFKNSVPKGATYAQAYSDYYYTFVRDIIETSDGIIHLFGEEFRQEPGNQFTNPMAKTRNVLIDAFNQQGDVVNSTILFKKQERYNTAAGVFANIIDAKDKILVVYNSSKKHNINENIPIENEYEMKNYEKDGIVVVCEIQNGQVGKKYQIMDCSKTKTLMESFYKISDNSAIVVTSKDREKYSNVLTW